MYVVNHVHMHECTLKTTHTDVLWRSLMQAAAHSACVVNGYYWYVSVMALSYIVIILLYVYPTTVS